MKKLLSIILLLMVFTIGQSQSPAVFRHPGIFSSQAELDFIKAAVAANAGSPIVAGYQALSNDSRGSLTYNPEPYAVVNVIGSGSSTSEDAFRRDAHATYAHAIKWVVTGNAAHKTKAIQIMNAWSSTFQSITTPSNTPNQPTLEASWALPIWLAGAEIIKTYNNGAAGWPSGEVSAFNSFVRKILTYVNGPIYQTANWLISKDLSLMSAGVFLNDASLYNSGYNHVTGQFDAITSIGEIPELYRDFVHSQYVLIGLTESAEVAHQQGDNALFLRTSGLSQPRLLVGAEAYVKGLLGTGSPNYQSESAWARKSAPYEILLARYTQLGLSIPQTQNYVLNQNRTEDAIENHFVGWLTATHSQLPSGASSCEPVSASANDGNVPANVLDNDMATRWSAEGDGQWIQFCLGNTASITGVQIAFYNGNVRTSTFDVQVSADGNGWTSAASGLVSGGTSLALQTFSFAAKTGKYVRIVGHGNSVNLWNSYTEVKINTEAVAGAPIGQTIWLRGFNNQYVSSKNGEGPMWCNATAVQGWNQFLVVDAGGGKIALQNVGKYVSSENGTQAMTCNRTAFQDWEKFDWIINSDGSISLRGNNGYYVSSENGTQAMTCTRTAIGGWEMFAYGTVSALAATTTSVASNETAITSYPNPVVNQLTYRAPVGSTEHVVEVKDSTGNLVLRLVAKSAGENTLDTSSWKPGTYYIRISSGAFSQSFKVLKR
ncbi:MAG TPA: discoidin domain-containing protein [Ohtaekwangia sp.]|uniref:discoidin domain-containing protein n=1 Tax=Ohtaekwangia sp. TaxID=2066019 RepID=UPI002F94BD46